MRQGWFGPVQGLLCPVQTVQRFKEQVSVSTFHIMFCTKHLKAIIYRINPKFLACRSIYPLHTFLVLFILLHIPYALDIWAACYFKKLFIISSKPDMLSCCEYKKQTSNPLNCPQNRNYFLVFRSLQSSWGNSSQLFLDPVKLTGRNGIGKTCVLPSNG